MDVEQGIRWINSEFTGIVGGKDRHYRNDLGTTVSKTKKGKDDSTTDKVARSLW